MSSKFRLSAEPLEERETPANLFATANSTGTVTAYDSTNWAQLFQITPFPSVAGGVRVTTADVNGDGTPDVIVSPKAGGGPVVNIYNGTNGSLLNTFLVGDAADRSGVSVASVGKNAVGSVILAVGTVKSGISTVEFINGADGTVVNQFVPFAGFKGGLSLAAADLNSDGVTDIIVGAQAGGSPRVAAFSGTDQSVLFNSIVFEQSFTGGVEVSVGPLNSKSSVTSVIVSAGFLGGPRVTVYNPSHWTVAQNFFAFNSNERNGVSAGIFTSSAAGTSNALIATDGVSGTLAAFDPSTLASMTAPSLSGLPGGLPVTTMAPTVVASSAGDAGMTNTVPNTATGSWQILSGGVQKQDVATGSGAAVTSSSKVTVYYSGYLTNGTVFDSARSPKSPATFQLTGLIQGWQIGLAGMQVGGIRNIFIPAALAYGSTGSGVIPANADLYFQVKLVTVA